MAGNYLASDDLFNAFDALLAALESDKSNVEACTLLGLVALDLDQIQVANRAFLAITMAPGGDEAAGLETKSFAYYQLGRLAREAGDVTKARMLVNKAVSANPENQEARTLLHELKVAERE
jgi:Tfp pilus assembly protein PilF